MMKELLKRIALCLLAGIALAVTLAGAEPTPTARPVRTARPEATRPSYEDSRRPEATRVPEADPAMPEVTQVPKADPAMPEVTQVPEADPAMPEVTKVPEADFPVPEVTQVPDEAPALPEVTREPGEDSPRPAKGYVLVTTATQSGWLPLPEEGETSYPLRQLLPDGTEAVNTIHLSPEGVYMEDSTCEGHDCVEQGLVTLDNRDDRILGNMIICLPNQVTLQLFTPEELLEMMKGQ